jgi:hypothetical protein
VICVTYILRKPSQALKKTRMLACACARQSFAPDPPGKGHDAWRWPEPVGKPRNNETTAPRANSEPPNFKDSLPSQKRFLP